VSDGVRVRVIRIGESAEADRYLDEMERASGLRGEPHSDGRLYVFEGEDLDAATHRIVDHLPQGWQDHLVFRL
jgi:hypothetical protein